MVAVPIAAGVRIFQFETTVRRSSPRKVCQGAALENDFPLLSRFVKSLSGFAVGHLRWWVIGAR